MSHQPPLLTSSALARAACLPGCLAEGGGGCLGDPEASPSGGCGNKHRRDITHHRGHHLRAGPGVLQAEELQPTHRHGVTHGHALQQGEPGTMGGRGPTGSPRRGYLSLVPMLTRPQPATSFSPGLCQPAGWPGGPRGRREVLPPVHGLGLPARAGGDHSAGDPEDQPGQRRAAAQKLR